MKQYKAWELLPEEKVFLKSEVDEAIAELKDKLQLDEDEMAGFLQLEEECGGGDLRNYIAELKDKLHDVDNQWNEQCKEIAKLKAKLESVQASAYADSVDAGMRERRLRRALYKACANWASCKACLLAYVGSELYAKKWERMFYKCLKKVEEYK